MMLTLSAGMYLLLLREMLLLDLRGLPELTWDTLIGSRANLLVLIDFLKVGTYLLDLPTIDFAATMVEVGGASSTTVSLGIMEAPVSLVIWVSVTWLGGRAFLLMIFAVVLLVWRAPLTIFVALVRPEVEFKALALVIWSVPR